MEVVTVLKLLSEKGYIEESMIENILKDDDFHGKKKKKKTTEERIGKFDSTKCHARLWNEGYGNLQCSRSFLDGECFCKSHLKEDGWWLGKFCEIRPENPVHPKTGEHNWKKEGEEVKENEVKEDQDVENTEKPVKKKRGRPKGSKNKKKVKEEKVDLTIEEIAALLEKKKKEKEDNLSEDQKEEETVDDENSGNEKIYRVDGVPYEIMDGKTIIDPNDYSEIGKSNGHGGIDFLDEDAKEKHDENIMLFK